MQPLEPEQKPNQNDKNTSNPTEASSGNQPVQSPDASSPDTQPKAELKPDAESDSNPLLGDVTPPPLNPFAEKPAEAASDATPASDAPGAPVLPENDANDVPDLFGPATSEDTAAKPEESSLAAPMDSAEAPAAGDSAVSTGPELKAVDSVQKPETPAETLPPSDDPSVTPGQNISSDEAGSGAGPAVITSSMDPTADTTPPPPGTVMSGVFGGANTASPVKRQWFKRPIGWAGIAAVVLLLVAGYVFGIYIPNKPENVFKTGLSRTGQAADRLITTGTDPSKLNSVKTGDFSGDIAVKGPDGTQSGTFSSRYDDTKSDSSLTYKSGGTENLNISAQALTDLPKGEKFPDVYFKVSGFSGLGLDAFAPGVNQYDGKWISISSAFLKKYMPADSTDANNQTQLSAQDAADLSKVFVKTTREYVFTNDPKKNVLENRGFKAKEKIDGNITADHYTVGINKSHAADYCKALVNNVMGAPAYKHIPGVSSQNLNDEKKTALEDCDTSANGIKDSDTFDMWIGTSKKLINKVRFTDSTDKTTYVDVGQSYSSGNVLPMYVTAHSDKDHYNVKFSLTADFDKSSSNGTVDGNWDDGGQKWTVSAHFAFKPYKGDVKIAKPTNAVPIEQVLQSMGIDPSMFMGSDPSTDTTAPATTTSASSGIQAKAQDSERQTDIMALQGQLEAYYAENGWYPTLSQVNDATWRSQNMKGLDSAALADPVGGKQALATAATATQYGYSVSNCDGTPAQGDCQNYKLTAILSDGELFVRESLN